jgi:hypothetical protein
LLNELLLNGTYLGFEVMKNLVVDLDLTDNLEAICMLKYDATHHVSVSANDLRTIKGELVFDSAQRKAGGGGL